jgi:hypothetical protein
MDLPICARNVQVEERISVVAKNATTENEPDMALARQERRSFGYAGREIAPERGLYGRQNDAVETVSL